MDCPPDGGWGWVVAMESGDSNVLKFGLSPVGVPEIFTSSVSAGPVQMRLRTRTPPTQQNRTPLMATAQRTMETPLMAMAQRMMEH